MDFHVGDQVIHSSFGLGEITKIEDKRINGHVNNYYVVSINTMTVWVPVDEGHSSLRIPTPPNEFLNTLPILSSPEQDLQEDRVLRKKQLLDQLKDGQLASICRVIRDLTGYQRKTKLNDQEKSILERAVRSLLTEWTLSLGTSPNQAQQAMESMLHG